MITKTPVYLDDRQCAILMLISKATEAWDMKNGSVEVFFDSNGSPSKAKVTAYTQLTPAPIQPAITVVL